MAKIHSIKRRIKSVQNIHQITKAMELVAASKLRRAQEAALHSRLYANSAREAIQSLEATGLALAHPLLNKRPVTNHTLVIFTSDRGLAGAYNANIFKVILQTIEQSGSQILNAIVVGQKGAQFVSRLQSRITVEAVYTNWPTQPTSVEIRPIAKTVIEAFSENKTDLVTSIYTDFQSIARQQAVARTLLPLTINEETAGSDKKILFEPSPLQVLEYVLSRIIELQLYQASLEASASEHVMRMIAMKNASDNADGLKEDLTLLYNGARQAAITQELAEISSGAEAIS